LFSLIADKKRYPATLKPKVNQKLYKSIKFATELKYNLKNHNKRIIGGKKTIIV
jgi:hypothetical protein